MSDIIVQAEHIVHTFGGKVKALDDISLSFERGIIYGLLGPNGAGKTTLIRVLTTLLKPESGSAFVAGIDVINHAAAAREKIGLAGQNAAVDGYQTGRENLLMVGRLYNLSKGEAKKRADDVLERIDLTDAADRQVHTYSGGMKRRLDLAASIVGHPEVLFLDEPTTGIDPRSRLGLWEIINELVADGTTLLLTTQYLEEADRLADRIGVIDQGQLIAEGTADELKTQVGGDVIEIQSADELDVLADTLRRSVDGEPVVNRARKTVTIPAPKAARSLLEAVRVLDDAGIEVHDIALRRPTLDDVFLTLTGKATEEMAVPEKQKGRRSR